MACRRPQLSPGLGGRMGAGRVRSLVGGGGVFGHSSAKGLLLLRGVRGEKFRNYSGRFSRSARSLARPLARLLSFKSSRERMFTGVES